MNAADIQKVVLGSLTIAGGQRLHSTEVSLSDAPDDPRARKTVAVPSFICGALLTPNQFDKFRTLCNALGVWVKVQHRWPLSEVFNGRDDKWEYSLFCTESWNGPIIRILWPLLLAAGITAMYLIIHGYVRL